MCLVLRRRKKKRSQKTVFLAGKVCFLRLVFRKSSFPRRVSSRFYENVFFLFSGFVMGKNENYGKGIILNVKLLSPESSFPRFLEKPNTPLATNSYEHWRTQTFTEKILKKTTGMHVQRHNLMQTYWNKNEHRRRSWSLFLHVEICYLVKKKQKICVVWGFSLVIAM